MKARRTGPSAAVLVGRNLLQLALVATMVWAGWGQGSPLRAAAGGVAGGLLGWDVSSGLGEGHGPRVGPVARRVLPFALAGIGALFGAL